MWGDVLVSHEVSLSIGEHGVCVDVAHDVAFYVDVSLPHLFLTRPCNNNNNNNNVRIFGYCSIYSSQITFFQFLSIDHNIIFVQYP